MLAFLGADPQKFPTTILASGDSKATNPRVAMTNDIRERITVYFADELRAEIFGGPAEEWPKRYGLSS